MHIDLRLLVKYFGDLLWYTYIYIYIYIYWLKGIINHLNYLAVEISLKIEGYY